MPELLQSAARKVLPAVVLSLMFTGFAHSQDAWLQGEWCSLSSGEKMYVEAEQLGFNDHTICSWQDKPQAGEEISARISCATMTAEGHKMSEATSMLHVVKTGPRSISVRLED